MQIIVPIYVHQQRSRGSASAVTARPLFFEHPAAGGAELGRVIAKLTNELRKALSDLARKTRHDDLLCWHDAQPVHDQVLKLNLDLRDSTATLRLMVVSVRRHNRLLAFSPSLPDLWFDIEHGETVQQRALEVYQAYFRQRRKEQSDYPVAAHSIEGKAWVDEITIDVLPQPEVKKPTDPLRALLGGKDVSDGAAQLNQVGRCLNWLDIDDLADPIGIDAEIRRLDKLLSVGDRRGVVLVGPSGSGKTARIEGVVRHRIGRKRAATDGQIWHLSPARLISGMSYLGQWQERVLAILRHAHRIDYVLYFDDLLGLFEAGKTRDSAMCVADTLAPPQLEIRPVRILAEMTSEAWAILRERDRTLADRFVVLPTAALDVEQSMDILIGVRRRLEARHHCKFDVDVLPEVISMYDRFERTSVLPGKAAAALSRLATRAPRRTIKRGDAVEEFQSRSGLQPSIIDRRVKITRETVTNKIRQQVVGQDEPVAKLTDRVLIAAARMNDTTRPLGTFLLVGPTGVGKTQLAKAIASCLFDEGGLIRLDMNELSSAASAARLVGTFDAPDGLLTSAVRRRPHAVLLLDEIEKAHPTVLDVLLQALGEARLSDARGRTVDLSGLLILMTSNLGSRQSGRGRGFATAEDHHAIAEVHDRAVREFFRPEFFNRIDGVLSFDRLSIETMESIAWMQFKAILRRDGLQRRSVLIDIDPQAMRQTAIRGYDPRMGARALKRQIERDLVRPAAEVLAASPTEHATLLRLFLDDDEQVQTRWQSVEFVARQQPTTDISIDALCQSASTYLQQVQDEIDDRPLSIEMNGQSVDPKLLETMTLRDSLHQCQTALRWLDDVRSRPQLQRPQATPIHIPTPHATSGQARFEPNSRHGLRDLQAADDIQDFLRDCLIQTTPGQWDADRERMIDALGRLHHQLAARGTAVRWLVWTRWYGEESEPDHLSELLEFGDNKRALSVAIQQWACEVEDLVLEHVSDDATVCCFSGALAQATLREISGSWMMVRRDARVSVADVQIMPVDESQPIECQISQWKRRQSQQPLGAVRRILQSDGPQIDLGSGAAVNEMLLPGSIGKLLSGTRRALDFLTEAGEKTS